VSSTANGAGLLPIQHEGQRRVLEDVDVIAGVESVPIVHRTLGN
jgi:hypothetical protein